MKKKEGNKQGFDDVDGVFHGYCDPSHSRSDETNVINIMVFCDASTASWFNSCGIPLFFERPKGVCEGNCCFSSSRFYLINISSRYKWKTMCLKKKVLNLHVAGRADHQGTNRNFLIDFFRKVADTIRWIHYSSTSTVAYVNPLAHYRKL